jgi:hypothetical protein
MSNVRKIQQQTEGKIMEQVFIENLKRIVEKYPYPRILKILASLIPAMMGIRKLPTYLLVSIRTTEIASKHAAKELRHRGEVVQGEFLGEMMQVNQMIVVMFPDLTQEGAEAIREYCAKIMPAQDHSLENFLSARFNAPTCSPGFSTDIPGQNKEDLEATAAAIEVVGGFQNERFVLKPPAPLDDAEIKQAIVDSYQRDGYALTREHDAIQSVIVEKLEELITITFSNYGDSVHVTSNIIS